MDVRLHAWGSPLCSGISRQESDTLDFSIWYHIEELAKPVGWRTVGLRPAGYLGIRLVIWCAHGSCNGDAERTELVAQAVARNAQDLGRLQLVPPSVPEHTGEQ